MNGYVYVQIFKILHFLDSHCLEMDYLQQELPKIERETDLNKNHILEVLYKLEEYGYVLRAYGQTNTSYHITTKGRNLMLHIKKNASRNIPNNCKVIPIKSKSPLIFD
ncbi:MULTISPECIES: DUF3116 family protein [Listeria]|uniref:DUF3116 family protein n=1 Tax=Listeria TaxID=1637 RepID=UPI0013565887|nr:MULTISPECIES: DUF3116 family protein [Listeria]